MSKRPKGSAYRGLTLRGSSIWFEERKGTDRTTWIRASCETSDWQEAAAIRQRILDLRDHRKANGAPGAFSNACDAYLGHAEESSDGLSGTTLADRRGMLGEGGHIREWFGETPLDVIDRKLLRAWWADVLKRRKRQVGDERDKPTGALVGSSARRNYLNALSAVFDHSDVSNPVKDFRRSRSDSWSVFEARLSAPALELLDEKIQAASWYRIDAYESLTEFLWNAEGDGRVAYLRKRGAQSAELVLATGMYQQVSYLQEQFGPEDPAAGTLRGRDITPLPGRRAKTGLVRPILDEGWEA